MDKKHSLDCQIMKYIKDYRINKFEGIIRKCLWFGCWILLQDIKATASVDKFPYPIIADEKRELAVKFGMLDPDEVDKAGLPLTARCVSMS